MKGLKSFGGVGEWGWVGQSITFSFPILIDVDNKCQGRLENQYNNILAGTLLPHKWPGANSHSQDFLKGSCGTRFEKLMLCSSNTIM